MRDVTLVEGAIELVFNFAQRTLRVRKELNELTVAASFESLSDIRAAGNRGPANLTNECVIRRTVLRGSEDKPLAGPFARIARVQCLQIVQW